LLLLAALPASAVLVDLGPGSFTPAATVITFSEPGYPVGTVNPVYSLAAGTLGMVTVSFGGHFVGQAAGGGFPVTLIDTTPTGPLALDPAAPATSIVTDAAAPTSPVLSGTPIFNGPISVLFSVPVAAVGLSGGFFDAVGSTTITAFDATGATLGSIVNTVEGIEFYGLADSTGANVIKGISFYITGPEPAGFGIDNLTFGAADVVVIVPEPGVGILLATGLGSLLFFSRRLRRRA
jgi:hypothetical protein